jgi:hypothetical protein
VCFTAVLLTASAGKAVELAPVPQDQGLPYTRSAPAWARQKLGNTIAVFAGSRYALVHGYKVRLDDADWRTEVLQQDGRVLVPASFAGVLTLNEPVPEPAPAYLADRWTYTLRIPSVQAPTLRLNGKPYVDLSALARRSGLEVWEHPRGLVVIGGRNFSFTTSESNLLETVITQFDSPEKFADPDIATRHIPQLARQGAWTNHVKFTSEQLAIFHGPESVWPTVPKRDYRLRGFNARLLGSKVPAPGVYPRVLFSPEDVPAIADRIRRTAIGQKSLIEMQHLFERSWWDTNTSDGRIFQQLACGESDGLMWRDAEPWTVRTVNTAHLFQGQQPGIHNTHVAYVPECLTTMALYCLLTGDDAHGRATAAAIVNYYRLREPLIDEVNRTSDTEFAGPPFGGNGAVTHWRGMHGLVAHMNLGLALDFAGKWMTSEERDTMRRIIAKATYGRRGYGQDAPLRFRDVNWVTWDLPQLLAVTAIEGLEGFDREAYESGAETLRAFLDWGIDDAGVVFESNGKTSGSFQFITLSLVAQARRGDNLFGHPHLRKLLEAQVQMTSPNGRVVVNSGTQYEPYSRQRLSLQFVSEMNTFYPGTRLPDYILSTATDNGYATNDEYARGWSLRSFDATSYRTRVADVKRLRLPSPMYPGFVPGVLYDEDFRPTTRSDLGLPLDFTSISQGVFSSYSDRTTNAVWMNLMVRPNHYLGAGHHHADAGMFHFSALGVDWFTQSPMHQEYGGKFFNLVQVDGESQPTTLPEEKILGWNAAAKYLGSTGTKFAAAASADLTYAYSYRWLTQPPQEWNEGLRALSWEVEPAADVLRIFAGTARYKMRPWWSTYTFANFMPTSRAPFNPMQHVFRTTGLVRGNHSYGFVLDDVRKDDAPRLYQWAAMLNGGVWRAEVPGLPANQFVLGFRGPATPPTSAAVKPPIQPQSGEPLLLVVALGMDASGDATLPLFQVETLVAPAGRANQSQFYDRLVINQRAVGAQYRVLLIPFRFGEALPTVSTAFERCKVEWPNQRDQFRFHLAPEGRTRVQVIRQGREICFSP